jgi:tyrosine-protein kinase Etk/Wzc
MIPFLRDALSSRSERVRVLGPALAVLLAAAIYCIATPNWFQSTLTVVPSKPSKTLSGGSLDLLSAGGLDLGGSGMADVDRVAAVLQSNAVSDDVIRKFELMKRYRVNYIEAARKQLWEHCFVRVISKGSLVSLSCEDTDPEFVRKMLEHFFAVGNDSFRRISRGSVGEEVDFLENRITEVRAESEENARKLRQFEEEHKLIDIDTQSRAVISTIAALRSQQISKELELDYLRGFSSSDEATARQIARQMGVLESKLETMEGVVPGEEALGEKPRAPAARRDPGKIFPAAMSVPKLRSELEKLIRDRRVVDLALVTLMQRLENAKANQARDVSAFLLLDPPALPTYRYRPRRALILLMSALAGLAIGILLAWWPRRGGAITRQAP